MYVTLLSSVSCLASQRLIFVTYRVSTGMLTSLSYDDQVK